VRPLRLSEHSERSVARNLGLREARGEFVMFLDDDDRLRPQALAYLLVPLRRDPRAVAAVGARVKFREGVYATRINHPVALSRRLIWPSLRTTRKVIWRELLAGWGWSAVSGQTLYRTEMVRRAGGYPPHVVVVEDRVLWLNISRLGPVLVLPSVVLDYREHEGQWRPANLLELRRSVFTDFIAGLPRDEQRRARRVRKSGDLLQRADDEYARANYKAALKCYLKSCLVAPSLFFSPLTAPPIIRGVAASLARLFRPRIIKPTTEEEKLSRP
jgi:glycosyltransferase involved in cell wall biosynthesis